MTDYVFPYVNMDDKIWKASYIAERRKLNLSTDINSIRFRDNGRLKYVFRGIDKFMPWINKIHMIVSNIEQVPDWIDQDKVHIVLHKDIIPAEFLPIFNSTAIEMFLGNIPDLADRFIYGNDDFYAIRNIDESAYFDNNIPKIKLKNDNGLDTQFKRVEYNTQRLIADYFKIKLENPKISFYKVEHTMAPLTKEICNTVLDKFHKEIYNSITSFRNDKNYNQYIYTYYAYFSGIYLPSERTYKYSGLSKLNCKNVFDYIKEQKTDTICLNDNTKNEVLINFLNKGIKEAFETILPDKCKYEKE